MATKRGASSSSSQSTTIGVNDGEKQKQKQRRQQPPLPPILIIPGFLSSGLQVIESTTKKEWVNKRIWCNLASLGISSIYFGTTAQQRSGEKTSGADNKNDVNNDTSNGTESQENRSGARNSTSSTASSNTEEIRQNKYKSSWINHMLLEPDMMSEQPGTKVRPIEGLHGVDYLADTKLFNSASYVFGPLIKTLIEDGGYVTAEMNQKLSSSISPTSNHRGGTRGGSRGGSSSTSNRTSKIFHPSSPQRSPQKSSSVSIGTGRSTTSRNDSTSTEMTAASTAATINHNKITGPPVNLTASTYDWRLPPCEMERRDKYFTKTLAMIETLYNDNNCTPILLMGHSLGTRVAEYLLRFALHVKGQEWIHTHIHTYIPVGAPHLGAPNAVRSIIAGDKMSLDAFLNDEEALVLGRSWGVVPWLFPSTVPRGVPSTCYVLPHGTLTIRFTQPIQLHDLVPRQSLDATKPTKFQMMIVGRGLSSDPLTLQTSVSRFNDIMSQQQEEEGQVDIETGSDVEHRQSDDEDIVYFGEEFSFGTWTTPPSPSSRRRDPIALHFLMHEPFWTAVGKKRRTLPACLARYLFVRCFCCSIWGLVYRLFHQCMIGPVLEMAMTGDVITQTIGKSMALGISEPIELPDEVWDGESVTLDVPLLHREDLPLAKVMECLGFHPRAATAQVEIQWTPYSHSVTSQSSSGQTNSIQPCSPISCRSSSTDDDDGHSRLTLSRKSRGPGRGRRKLPNLRNSGDGGGRADEENDGGPYQEQSGNEMLLREGLEGTIMKAVHDMYDLDPFGPRSSDAPPVKHVHAIYGVNLPTEIGGVFKRNDTCSSDRKIASKYGLDTNASIVGGAAVHVGVDDEEEEISSSSNNGYILNGGILKETTRTKQPFANNKNLHISGDGTVPYYSLRHCKTWDSPTTKVTVQELDRAEHRAILADTRFHKEILSYARGCLPRSSSVSATSNEK